MTPCEMRATSADAFRVDARRTPSVVGADLAALIEICRSFEDEPRRARLRGKQLFHWLYHRGSRNFEEMSTLPTGLRDLLRETYAVDRLEIVANQASTDGTRKWLLRFPDGQQVETVFIPEEDRGALCVSSQVGCSLTCSFCHTGTMPMVRNLTAAEIIAQIVVARDELGEWPTGVENRSLTNIVFMGMGEPLFNYANTLAALRLAMNETGSQLFQTADHGFDFRRRSENRPAGQRRRRWIGDLVARRSR